MKFVIAILTLVGPFSYAQVNYYDHIKPIIEAHCISCHAEGKIGPMALDTYDNVSAFASMIEFVTTANIMPPWRASQDLHELSISKYLSSKEKNILRDWIESGMLEGNENADTSNVEKGIEPIIIDSVISKYDTLEYKEISLKVEQQFAHEGNYKMHQRVYVVPTNLDKNVYVKKLEFIPSNSKIVLGCDISVDVSRKGRKYDAMDPRSGYANVIGVGFRPQILNWYSWSPDDIQEPLDGYKVLPAGSDLLLYISYAPTAKVQLDQSQIVLTYSEVQLPGLEIVSEVLIDSSSLDRSFFVSKNSTQHIRAEYEFEENVKIRAIRPYGQLICENWQIIILNPNGHSYTLLEVDDWQFKWQRKFRFTNPVEVAKGSKIIAKAIYNNTIENIDIPIFPTKDVYYGEGKNQELFLVSFDYTKMN